MQIEDLKREYCSPEVEVIEVEVETGFAGSPVKPGGDPEITTPPITEG